MIEICFEEKNDAIVIYKELKKRTDDIYAEISIYLYEQMVIVHIPIQELCYIDRVVIPVLVQYIINTKQDEWISDILKEKFYYGEREERIQILHMAHSILNGRRKGLNDAPSKQRGKELVVSSLRGWMHDKMSFSFEAYIRFRLRKYNEFLYRTTEMAIDEYKLEQEYQMFVETLRQQVSSRKSRLSCLHLVFDDSFIFYDEKGARLKQDKLVQYIEEELLSQKGLYIDPNIMAPLLSISPKTIHLYTKEQDHNMIVTIQNVFQERVQLYALHEFEKNVKNYKNKGNALDFLNF
ncbi:putative sporulation protein YtxC [Bacillus sp. AFS018417]|uniref:putative sporulation protein YtxC n=1 Tax=unclassified Bacillus (in: firmicutes) TaxID=185979 RepID=UPI000BF589B4|nr:MULTISPECIES: putative sporulation protein YtxC [unclassified Bacillus (in: firmicutes)]MCP1125449.1 putative sporulation protein YtxC [Bacillus sp. 3103sda1]PEZ10493.1 putative sporulation protein YtxC [Bacillus sp. AFS018417]